MEYTQEMYEEDLKLAYYTYCRYFKCFYKYKDDLIASSLNVLSKYRLSYDDSKGKYSTYACKACWCAMQEFLRRERKQSLKFDIYSLDRPVSVGSDNNLSDFIVDDNINMESNLNIEYIIRVVNELLLLKKQMYKKVIYLLMQGYIPLDIARILGVSRQNICQYREKFKVLLKERLQKDNYLV